MRNYLIAVGLGAALSGGISFGLTGAIPVGVIAVFEFLCLAVMLMLILNVTERQVSPFLTSALSVAAVTGVSLLTGG